MDLLQNILYINLEKRKDKKDFTEKQLKKINRTAIRINAIDHSDSLNKDHRILGCTYSHLKALEYAIENKYENVLITEDDSDFLTDKVKLDIPEDAIIVYLSWKVFRKTETDVTLVKGINKIKNAVLSNAYFLPNRAAILTVYNTIVTSKRKYPIDLMFKDKIQKTMPCYAVYPPPVLQTDEFISDIHHIINKRLNWNKSDLIKIHEHYKKI
jgi:GR25 family glycosyltransferase involved in LPS biosynthesis